MVVVTAVVMVAVEIVEVVFYLRYTWFGGRGRRVAVLGLIVMMLVVMLVEVVLVVGMVVVVVVVVVRVAVRVEVAIVVRLFYQRLR